MEKIALDLGSIQIYWYSIFILLGIIVANFIISREAKKRGIEKEFLNNLTFYTIVIGIIGARLYYCLFNLSYYLANPIEIIKIWHGGLAIHGGIIAGCLTVIFYCRKYKVQVLKMLDIIVVGVIIGQAIGRWGNFFNSEAYGAVTTLETLHKMHLPQFVIDGMYISGAYRQPTFFLEFVWNITGFFALLFLRKLPHLKTGQLTGFYLIWYSLGRFPIESLRTDSLMLGSIKIAQLMSAVLFIIGIILFIYYKVIKKSSKLEHLYRDSYEREKVKQPLFYKENDPDFKIYK